MTLVTRKWTRAEYRKMIDSGLLQPEERVELIQGLIVALSPIDPLHSKTVDRINRLLTLRLANCMVRVQNPVLAGVDSEPQPDLSVIPLDQAERPDHPDWVELIVEVANTSLAYDRAEKGSLYASAGFPHYWIVNLVENQLEVYTDPAPAARAPFGSSYAAFRRLGPGATVEFAGQRFAVSDLLPPG